MKLIYAMILGFFMDLILGDPQLFFQRLLAEFHGFRGKTAQIQVEKQCGCVPVGHGNTAGKQRIEYSLRDSIDGVAIAPQRNRIRGCDIRPCKTGFHLYAHFNFLLILNYFRQNR
jgi:hypothetical protein